VQVSGITNATTISAGYYHSCAVLSTGGVDCWGSNNYGQLGNGTTTDSDVPVQVSGITNATTISAGYYHSCAVLSTGGSDCWGSNNYGQLGNGATTGPDQFGSSASPLPCSTTPVQVSGITNATAIAGGSLHSCALLTTGGVDCWGSNGIGALGNGTTTDSSIPVAVSGIPEPARFDLRR
jgi:hypothetical protein